MQPIKEHLIDQLHPHRHPLMSMKMVALIGYILDVRLTKPAVIEMKIDWESMSVFALYEGETEFEYFESIFNIDRNWYALLDYAKLTEVEAVVARSMYETKFHNSGAALELWN